MATPPRQRPMGVTILDMHYTSPAEVPASALRTPGISLDVRAVNAQLHHWSQKLDAAATVQQRTIADGVIHALVLIRIIHGLPPVPQD